jgi:hypothetical protein
MPEKEEAMKVGFEKWWDEQGRFLDPDTEDVPWYDKREALANLAFDEGVKIGMARAGNYTANSAAAPSSLEFANGRTVRIKAMSSPDNAPYLEVGLADLSPILPDCCPECGSHDFAGSKIGINCRRCDWKQTIQ